MDNNSDTVVPEIVTPVTEISVKETEAPTTKKNPPVEKDTSEEYVDDYGFEEEENDTEDARQVGPQPDVDTNETSAGSLTIVVAVIAAVVLISLLAAVVSAFRSPPTSLPGPGPVSAAESVPLQQQQAAQMDW